MKQLFWHLLYIAITCGVTVIMWHRRRAIAGWWATTAEQRAAMAARLRQRLKDIGER